MQKSHSSENDLRNNFQEGDLVYGLCATVLSALSKLPNYPFAFANNRNTVFFGNLTPDAKSTPHLSPSLERDTYHHNRLRQLLLHPHLSESQKDYINFLINDCGEHYHFAQDTRPHEKVGKGASIKAAFIRRACKAVMLYTIRNKNTIHYLLTHIHQESVIQKLQFFTQPPIGQQFPTFFRTITPKPATDHSYIGSELRFIYRYWDLLSPYVKFYIQEKLVPPPWENSKFSDHWSSYHPKKNGLLFVQTTLCSTIATKRSLSPDIEQPPSKQQKTEAVARSLSL